MKRLADMTEPEIARHMHGVAIATESIMPAADNPRGRAGFVVIVFDEPGILRYVTNVQKQDAKAAIRQAFNQEEI